jgi:hypothetical protein
MWFGVQRVAQVGRDVRWGSGTAALRVLQPGLERASVEGRAPVGQARLAPELLERHLG